MAKSNNTTEKKKKKVAAKASNPEDNLIAKNRKAFFNYQIVEHIEAGVVLVGTEVKSLRAHSCAMVDAFADIRTSETGSTELWLLNLNIAPYKFAGIKMNHEPTRPRKLLLSKSQVKSLIGKLQQKGYTIVPLHIYFNKKGLVKVDLGLAIGKTHEDKRETIKQREWNRQKQRLLKE